MRPTQRKHNSPAFHGAKTASEELPRCMAPSQGLRAGPLAAAWTRRMDPGAADTRARLRSCASSSRRTGAATLILPTRLCWCCLPALPRSSSCRLTDRSRASSPRAPPQCCDSASPPRSTRETLSPPRRRCSCSRSSHRPRRTGLLPSRRGSTQAATTSLTPPPTRFAGLPTRALPRTVTRSPTPTARSGSSRSTGSAGYCSAQTAQRSRSAFPRKSRPRFSMTKPTSHRATCQPPPRQSLTNHTSRHSFLPRTRPPQRLPFLRQARVWS